MPKYGIKNNAKLFTMFFPSLIGEKRFNSCKNKLWSSYWEPSSFEKNTTAQLHQHKTLLNNCDKNLLKITSLGWMCMYVATEFMDNVALSVREGKHNHPIKRGLQFISETNSYNNKKLYPVAAVAEYCHLSNPR